MKTIEAPSNKPDRPIMRGMLSLENFSRNILSEDNHMLAVIKPAGMLLQGDRSGKISLLDLGKQWLAHTYHKPGKAFLGIVHRLDRPVSGVVLFAKTSKAARRISEQFRNRTPRKTYLAVVHGHLSPPRGNAVAQLTRIGHKSMSVPIEDATTRHAELLYETVQKGESTSLVKITLITGRRHQIRAQMAELGHPVYGDRMYGSPIDLSGGVIALHALSLTFHHPVGNHEITLEAPLPTGRPWKSLP